VATIWGNKVIPGILDRYLARTGYSSQQTDQPAGDGPDNIWDPVPGDHGAHGRFDDLAKSSSLQLSFTTHRRLAAGVAATAAAAAVGVFGARR
jgi:hypothetical protein